MVLNQWDFIYQLSIYRLLEQHDETSNMNSSFMDLNSCGQEFSTENTFTNSMSGRSGIF